MSIALKVNAMVTCAPASSSYFIRICFSERMADTCVKFVIRCCWASARCAMLKAEVQWLWIIEPHANYFYFIPYNLAIK